MGDWAEAYRYGPGNYIAPHTDASRTLKDGTLSTHVAVIYLNDDFEGGMTCFPQVVRTIKPQRGAGVVFEAGLQHYVTAVARGLRYSLRVDLGLSI
jgi:prolyl 4-hydroxylase